MALCLAGCATSVQQSAPVTTEERRAQQPTTEAARPAAQDYAVRARAALALGHYDTTIATAERGLRVNRYDAELYWLLAQAYSLQGMRDQAANFARLGLRYAGDNDVLTAQLQALLDDE